MPDPTAAIVKAAGLLLCPTDQRQLGEQIMRALAEVRQADARIAREEAEHCKAKGNAAGAAAGRVISEKILKSAGR